VGTTSSKSVAARLHIRPGQSIRVVRPPRQTTEILGQLPSGASVVKSGGADLAIFFAQDKDELSAHIAEAMKATEDLWIAYPKLASGKSDLSRQVVHDAFRQAGWKPVAQISMDDTWSAIRGRPA